MIYTHILSFIKQTLTFLVFLLADLTSIWAEEIYLPITSFSTDSLEIENVIGFCEDQDGGIWIGTQYSGIYLFQEEKFEKIDIPELENKEISAFGIDKYGRFWVGTPNGFYIMGKQFSKKNSYYKLSQISSHPSNHIEDFLVQDENICWIATWDGLIKFNPITKEKNIYKISKQDDAPEGAYENYFYCIEEDKQETEIIWLGSRYGLKSFNKQTKTFTIHRNPKKWHNISPAVQQFAMVDVESDPSGLLRMSGRSSGGVLIFDAAKDGWRQFLFLGGVLTDPYVHNAVNTLVTLGDSIVLYGGDEGIGYLDHANNELRPFQIIQNNQISNISTSFLDQSNRLWFGGASQLFYINIDQLKLPSGKQLPIVKSFLANGEMITGDFYDLKKFSKNVDEFTFFLGLTNPHKIEEVDFRWRLLGIDSDWQYEKGTWIAKYDELQGGKYQLRFQFKNAEGDWIEGDPIQLNIQKEWHESLLIILSTVLSLILLSIAIGWYLISRDRKNAATKLEYERKLAEAELTALRSQMNPHFIFNSLNSIYNFIHNNETENAAEYLAKFSKLMRIVLTNSRKRLVPLVDELRLLELYLELERIRFDEKFDYKISVDGKLDANLLLLAPMLIQPYIENAIWHGLLHKEGKGNITIAIEKRNSKLHFIIEDDGIGRTEARKLQSNRKTKSMGMKINKKRLEAFEIMYGASGELQVTDLVDANGNANGTKVHLILPIIEKNTNESNNH